MAPAFPHRFDSGAAAAPLRITRRGRIVLTTLITVPAALLIGSFALSSAPATASLESGADDFAYVTVADGESLWAVAERVAPQADPRDVIADIERLNGLEASAVSPGQSLAIPAAYSN
ncbi:hypothetical protein DDQ50_14415 [Amnibacterium flavum]|uniref:LysM domain-containing protein n=2 Tax=Amnibacterium flavum TaxID=2173173 RepID=A0A2V1HLZ8_9MICO|nr:hypothetical protein DDQ50_14415 [Amnibacterium flavum]